MSIVVPPNSPHKFTGAPTAFGRSLHASPRMIQEDLPDD
jgi:hypothetical protein